MTGGTVATSYGVTLTWTLEEDRVDHLLVRIDDSRGEFLAYSLARRDGTALCRCDHRDQGGATHCPDARRALLFLRAAAERARTATLPAPEGARVLLCDPCHAWWPASLGGACGRCGAAGTVWTPVAQVSKGSQYVLVSVALGAELVVEDLTRAGYAVERPDRGTPMVRHTKGALPGIKSALRAAGWEVVS